MYVLTVEVEIEADYRDAYKTIIDRQARTSVEHEEGCLVFDVSTSPEDPTRFLLYEVYRDRAAFDAHLQELHSRENGAMVKPWIRSQTIRFWTLVSGSRPA
jgi:quinol monooxygenase YgiN